MVKFQELPVSAEIQRAAGELGFENATEIQERAIPVILEGRDLIGRSQTGTGKTAAFAVPAVEMTDGENKEDVQVLVVCPTRELAIQSWNVFKKIYKYKSGVKAAVLYGGQPMERQIRELKRGINIVIGTPGRIMDHMRRRTLRLDKLKIAVLDEADEMLDMGFRDDIETILKQTPDSRQTLFFCATMPPEIMAITKTYLKQPELIEVNRSQVTITAIGQSCCMVPDAKKPEALTELLHRSTARKAIVFCNTQRMVDEVCRNLVGSGSSAHGIHGGIRQEERTKVMEGFKKGDFSILVATDVAARGIDARDVELVVNYDVPRTAEDYVHRIGRTGRAGKTGSALTIAGSAVQIAQVREFERVTKSTVEYFELPEFGHVKADAAPRKEQAGRQGFQPRANVADGMEKIVIELGKKQRIRPNHIVGAIAERTSLSGGDIGKILILLNRTIVEIPAGHKQEVLDALKDCKINGFVAESKPDRRQDTGFRKKNTTFGRRKFK